jgi:hypothetical protein
MSESVFSNADLEFITAEFTRAVAPYEPISCGVERHGSWEWTARRAKTLNRFVVLAVVSAGVQPGPESPFLYEVWVGADNGERYGRSLATRLAASFPHSKLGQPWDELDAALHDATTMADKLTDADLTAAFLPVRRTAIA